MFSQIAEITDYLFLSSASAAQEKNVRLKGITQVINCTMDIPNMTSPDIKCTRIEVDDNPHANLSRHFTRVSDLIENEKLQGGKTLVHCVAGVSRSATLCIAYLMKHQPSDLETAYKNVKIKRSVIRPNVGFFKQLIKYEEELHGRNTVRMVESPIGFVPDVYLEGTKHMVWLPDHPDTK